MLRLFISSHGSFASGILGAAEVLLGKQSDITVYDAYLDDTTLNGAVDAFFATVQPGDQVVLISDLYGGSVNTTLCEYLEQAGTVLISGANLALILALALEPAPISDARLQELVEQSREQLRIVRLDGSTSPAQSDDFFG